MTRLHPTDRSFLDAAPRTVEVSAHLDVPRADVWSRLADHGTWNLWYPGLSRCDAHDVGAPGARRTVRLGPLVAEERWVTWEPGTALGFTVERLNLPMARRMFELVELEDEDGGTRVRFRGGYEPHPLARVGFSRSLRTIEASWSTALTALGDALRRTTARSGLDRSNVGRR